MEEADTGGDGMAAQHQAEGAVEGSGGQTASPVEGRRDNALHPTLTRHVCLVNPLRMDGDELINIFLLNNI